MEFIFIPPLSIGVAVRRRGGGKGPGRSLKAYGFQKRVGIDFWNVWLAKMFLATGDDV